VLSPTMYNIVQMPTAVKYIIIQIIIFLWQVFL